MLAISVVTILASTVFMRIHIPFFKIAAIIFASFLALFSIYLLVIIIDPRGGILRKGDDTQKRFAGICAIYERCYEVSVCELIHCRSIASDTGKNNTRCICYNARIGSYHTVTADIL